MLSYFLSAWRSGLRGRSFHVVFVLGALLIGAAYLASQFSPRQPTAVALDVGFSGLRFSLVLLGLFWVQELVGREIDRRTTVIFLAYPLPRANYVLGRFLGIAALLLTSGIVLALLLWIGVLSASSTYDQSRPSSLGLPFWATFAALWWDVLVVVAFALCVAALSTVPALPLSLGAAFAIAGHSLGAVIQYLAYGADGQQDLVLHFSPAINLVQWVLPNLSTLDWRTWPIYDQMLPPGTVSLSLLMGACYISLMLALAILAFNRRDFD